MMMADWKTRQQALSMKMLEQGFMIEAAKAVSRPHKENKIWLDKLN